MSIEVQQLTKLYGEQRAVDGITFSVGKGEIVGFLGPNGAGKSTTMKMLTGYIPPDSGRATVAGFDLNDFGPEAHHRIGYLPEHNPLYDHMYIREYLDMIAGLHGMKNRAKRVNDVIDQTGLGKESHKIIGALSKGYRQRVGLARALISDPEVLILDEPTSGLDPNQLSGIRKLIKETGSSKTILLSTHIMQEVNLMCDRVLIINNGQLVADESVEELSRSKSGFSLLEVEFETALTKEQLGLLNLEVDQQITDTHYVFKGTDGKALSKSVSQYAASAGNAILRMTTVEKDLEAIFRELTDKNE